MALRVSGNPNSLGLEVLAFLLSYAITDDSQIAEEVFNESVISSRNETDKSPLQEFSPVSFSEFVGLFELFPFTGIDAAIANGLFGTSVRGDLGVPIALGVYANARGTQLLKNAMEHSSVLRRFPIRAVTARGGISFGNGGSSVSRLHGAFTGTMGAWLQEQTLGLLGISNNHVICEFNQFGKGTEVTQPGASDGGNKNDVIARVEDFVLLRAYNAGRPVSTANTADVAWCKPIDENTVSRYIGTPPIMPKGECDIDYDISTFNTVVDVCAYGKESQWMFGRAVALASSIWMQTNAYTPACYKFFNQIELQLDKVREGDSGAILMRKSDNRIGGILFALDPLIQGRAFAAPWSEVLRCAGLQFTYT